MDNFRFGLLCLAISMVVGVGVGYLVVATPTCEYLGGRTVQNGWTLRPVWVNHTLMMLPQPLYKCEGAKR